MTSAFSNCATSACHLPGQYQPLFKSDAIVPIRRWEGKSLCPGLKGTTCPGEVRFVFFLLPVWLSPQSAWQAEHLGKKHSMYKQCLYNFIKRNIRWRNLTAITYLNNQRLHFSDNFTKAVFTQMVTSSRRQNHLWIADKSPAELLSSSCRGFFWLRRVKKERRKHRTSLSVETQPNHETSRRNKKTAISETLGLFDLFQFFVWKINLSEDLEVHFCLQLWFLPRS